MYKYKLFTKVIIALIVSALSFSLLYFVFNIVFNGLFVNFVSRINFVFARYISEYKFETFSVSIIIVMIIVWIVSQIKTMGQLNLIINSIDMVFNKEESLIELSPKFKDVETKLNTIKYENIRNERLAKDAEQRKNDLVVYLAHDLKTPLTSVIGYLNLLNDEQGISNELRQKYVSISLEKAERLEDLINEFFEITRFSLQTITLSRTKVNLSLMINQIADEFYPLLSDKSISININVTGDICINADGDKIARVFDNLLKNAVNYSFINSEITIFVDIADKGINIRFRNIGDRIPPHQLNSIFEKFYRLDSARSSKTGGAGLGLAIAKEIVELHGGTISAISSDEYTEFQVILPA